MKLKTTNVRQYSDGQPSQQNKFPNQFLLNQQKPLSFPNNMNNYNSGQTPQGLFDNYQEAPNNNNPKFMKDVANITKKSPMQNNLFIKPNPNNYQPSLYQNFSPSINNFMQAQPNQKIQNGKENIVGSDFFNNFNNQNNGNGLFSNNNNNNNAIQIEDNVKEIESIKIKSEEDLLALNQRHQQLINTILGEEEEIISVHRQHIDDIVDCVKQVNSSMFDHRLTS